MSLPPATVKSNEAPHGSLTEMLRRNTSSEVFKFIAVLIASFCIVLDSHSSEVLIKKSELIELKNKPVIYRYWAKAASRRIPLPSNVGEYAAPIVKVVFFSNATFAIMPTDSTEYRLEFIAPTSSSAKLYSEIAKLEAAKKLDTKRLVYSTEETDQILKVLSATLLDAKKPKAE